MNELQIFNYEGNAVRTFDQKGAPWFASADICKVLEISNSNLTDSLFMFFSKDKGQVKILEIEKDNIWLYQNRLNNAKFVFPNCDKTIQIDSRQFKPILKSIELTSYKKK